VAPLVSNSLPACLVLETIAYISNRGCVTPPVLHNWWESTGQDLELVDGFDTLPEDAQEKVKRALEQGHVDDEDWNGVWIIAYAAPSTASSASS
jgi:hypothetical protein